MTSFLRAASIRYSKKPEKIETPLLGELSQTSRDSFESDSDSKESRDVRLNSFESGIFHFCHFWRNWAGRPRILSNRIPIRKNPGTFGLIPSKIAFFTFATFGDLSQSSQVAFESDSDSKESRDDWQNSFKSGVSNFVSFVSFCSFAHLLTLNRAVHHDARTQYRSNRIEYRIDRIEKMRNATFEGIKPNVPGFFRIGIRFERISGRSA